MNNTDPLPLVWNFFKNTNGPDGLVADLG